MNKKLLFLTLAILGLFNFNSNAQLADGTTAPDFSITDINGSEHQLYSYLNEGKTVVLSFFWTIDPIGWSNHSSGVLNDIWNQRGPNGTDDYFIIGIEGMESTTLDDLNGTGSSTYGNWVAGTSYPLVNLDTANTVRTDYNVNFYPLYYVICPEDTSVRVINPFSFDNLTINSGCVQENTSSVAYEFESKTFNIYPNPASDYIQLTFPEGVNKDSKIVLTNAIGKTVYSGRIKELENGRMPINHLPNGIYLVSFYSGGNVVSQRMSVR